MRYGQMCMDLWQVRRIPASRACPAANSQACHVLIQFPAVYEASKEINKEINRPQSMHWK